MPSSSSTPRLQRGGAYKPPFAISRIMSYQMRYPSTMKTSAMENDHPTGTTRRYWSLRRRSSRRQCQQATTAHGPRSSVEPSFVSRSDWTRRSSKGQKRRGSICRVTTAAVIILSTSVHSPPLFQHHQGHAHHGTKHISTLCCINLWHILLCMFN